MGTPGQTTPDIAAVLDALAVLARASGEFAEVRSGPESVTGTARFNAEALFRLEVQGNEVAVVWATPNRYLSQSIEADLMWTGDDLDDLIEEELAATGHAGGSLGKASHYRDEQKQFTFRSVAPVAASELDPQTGLHFLLAYARAFAELGDMAPDEGAKGA